MTNALEIIKGICYNDYANECSGWEMEIYITLNEKLNSSGKQKQEFSFA